MYKETKMQTTLRKSDYYYDLPEELIAQTPSLKRDESRLLVLNRKTGNIEHKHFFDIIDYLNPGDTLVLNNSKVIPARIFGHRYIKDKNGVLTDKTGDTNIEVLLLKRQNDTDWECIVHPGKKMTVGTKVKFSDELSCTVIDVLPDGNRVCSFEFDGEFYSVLDKVGQMPLPPYIHSRESQKERYQTVYAKHEGSSAAPTAGLHFTKELLCKIEQKGIKIAYVTLHVGLGTFRPVKEDIITNHKMHTESYYVSEESADIINDARQNGGRIICVGTTSCRTLESVTDENGKVIAGSGQTDIFIYPGYKFRAVDCLITNFHLPESTLIMLVSALCSRQAILDAYKCAVENKYRFFSFGDAMLIL